MPTAATLGAPELRRQHSEIMAPVPHGGGERERLAFDNAFMAALGAADFEIVLLPSELGYRIEALGSHAKVWNNAGTEAT